MCNRRSNNTVCIQFYNRIGDNSTHWTHLLHTVAKFLDLSNFDRFFLHLCTSSGKYGTEWDFKRGFFHHLTNETYSARNCPQCGCEGKFDLIKS